jgi:hypothetical protein
MDIDHSKLKDYYLDKDAIPPSGLDKCLSYYAFSNRDSLKLCIAALENESNPSDTREALKREVLNFLSQSLILDDSTLVQINYYINKYAIKYRDAYSLSIFYEKSKILNKRGEFKATIELLKESFFDHYPTKGDLTTLAVTARLYANLYKAYYRKNQYSKALENAIIAENIALQADHVHLLFDATSLFSQLYGVLSSPETQLGSQEDRERYMGLLEKSLKKATDLAPLTFNDKKSGIAVYNMALFYCLNDRIEESKEYLSQAITYGQKIEFHELLYNAYEVLADIHMDAEQLDSSFYYINLLKSETDVMNYPRFTAKTALKFLNYYSVTKAYDKASNLFDKLQKDETISNNLRLKKMLLLMGYELEKDKGNFLKSLEYYVSHQSIKDSITNATNTELLEALRTKYESELKDKEIQMLSTEAELHKNNIKKKNNLILFTLLSGIGLIGLLSFFFWQRHKLEEERTLNAKQKLLRTQLNPHFIFNALNSIQQYIYQKQNPQKVADYLAKFSRLTRRILQHSKKDLISLEEELAFIKDYMDLQQIRFDRPFSYTITIDEGLDVDDIQIPPMFTQPFIENAIEHGIFSKKDKGTIKIEIIEKDNMLVVILEDNGIGIEKTKLLKKNNKHQSLAINITRERLKILEKKFKQKAILSILDLSNHENLITGTKVQLTLPIIHY